MALVLGCTATAAAAPTWLPPEDRSAPLRDADDGGVAMDASAGIVAIWEREGSTPFNRAVQTSFRPPGGSFSATADVSSPAQDPVVAMNHAGEAVAAWWHSTAGVYTLQASVRPPGGSFGPAQDIGGLAPDFTGSPPSIQLEMNDAGAAVIAWLSRDPAPEPEPDVQTIEAVVRAPGGAFSEAETLSDVEDLVLEPDVAIDASGDAIAVWRVIEEEESVAQALAGSAPGGFSGAPVDLPKGLDHVSGLDVDATPGGAATVVFVGFDDPGKDEDEEPLPVEESRVEAISGQIGGPFSAPTALSDPTGRAFQPRLAIDAAGGAVVVWVDQEEPLNSEIHASVRPPGGSFPGPAGAVEIAGSGGNATSPSLAVNDQGAAVAVWQQGAPTRILASVRPPAGGFPPAAGISTPGADALFPDVAIAPTGDAVAAWRRFDGSHWILQSAGYDANPPVFRSISIPAGGTVGETVSVAADPFDVWGIASSSISFGDGGIAPGAAASHVYGAPGVYPVNFSATDAAGNPVSAGGSISIAAPRPVLKIRKRKRNRKKGTILLTVQVSGPGRVVLTGKGVKRVQKRARRAGSVKLLVKAKGKTLKRLNGSGKAKIRVKIVFDPDGRGPNAKRNLRLTLIKGKQKQRRSRR